MDNLNNVTVKYTYKGKVLNETELEKHKIFFDQRAFGGIEKTSAILKLREKTLPNKSSILYIDENFNLTHDLNI